MSPVPPCSQNPSTETTIPSHLMLLVLHACLFTLYVCLPVCDCLCVCLPVCVSTCLCSAMCVYLCLFTCVYSPMCVFTSVCSLLCVCVCVLPRTFQQVLRPWVSWSNSAPILALNSKSDVVLITTLPYVLCCFFIPQPHLGNPAGLDFAISTHFCLGLQLAKAML